MSTEAPPISNDFRRRASFEQAKSTPGRTF
jgi:hypothetical protein